MGSDMKIFKSIARVFEWELFLNVNSILRVFFAGNSYQIQIICAF